MKIGVVSDTHSQEIPKQLLEDFADVDFIVHAGDFCSLRDVKIFSMMKDLKAVYGNMDEPGILRLFPKRQILNVKDCSIGVCHGYGPSDKVLEAVQHEFENEKVDAVIFGHSHHPLNKKIGNVLYFNPGSPTDTVFAPYQSYGILEVKDDRIQGKIIKVTHEHG